MKKGMTEDLLRLITIAMGALVLVAVIGGIFLASLNNNSDIELCRYTFAAAAMSKKTDVLNDKRIDFDCKRRQVEIDKKEYFKGDTFLATKLKHKIAEEMRICNYMTNEGKSNPFETKYWEKIDACLICTEITFDKDIQDSGITLTNASIKDYMKETYIANSDITYWDYITDRDGNEFKSSISDLDSHSEYYLLYGSGIFQLMPWWSNGMARSGFFLVKKEDFNNLGCILVN